MTETYLSGNSQVKAITVVAKSNSVNCEFIVDGRRYFGNKYYRYELTGDGVIKEAFANTIEYTERFSNKFKFLHPTKGYRGAKKRKRG